MENSNKELLVSGLQDLISKAVEDLKQQILSIPTPNRSYFDTVKNWWNNIRFGHDNEENPYYHRNKLGALGLREYNASKIEEFNFFKETVLLLAEAEAAKADTKFEKIMNKWADDLKVKLNKFIQNAYLRGVQLPSSSQPPKEAVPEKVAPTEPQAELLQQTTTPQPAATEQPAAPQLEAPKTDVPDKIVEPIKSIFDTDLTEEQTNKLRQDFKNWFSLSSEEQKKFNDKGNFHLGMKPKEMNIIPSLNIELPFFIYKDDPRWQVLTRREYIHDRVSLSKAKKIDTPGQVTDKDAFLSISKEILRDYDPMSNLGQMFSYIIKRYEESENVNIEIIRSLIKHRKKLEKVSEESIQHIEDEAKNGNWEDVKHILNHLDEELKNESISSISTYKKRKINFSKDDTLYERVVECLVNLRK